MRYINVKSISIDTNMPEYQVHKHSNDIAEAIARGYEVSAVVPFCRGSIMYLKKVCYSSEDE